MKIRIGRITITTSGSEIALTSESDIETGWKMVFFQCKGDPDNTNDAFVGLVDVSTSIGWTLENNDPVGLLLPIREMSEGGSIDPAVIFFDATTNGEKIDYVAVFE